MSATYTPPFPWNLFPPPETLSVGPDDTSRLTAVQRLVRPNEVQDLISRPSQPSLHLAFSTFPERTAAWLEGQLRCQALRYLPDPPTRDIWQSPGFTRRRHGGDCEDLALLVVSLLTHENIPSYLVTGTINHVGHAWVEGTDERGWFMIEATAGTFSRGYRAFNGQLVRPSSYFAQRRFGLDAYERVAA